MLPKLHKQQCEYINIEENIIVETCLIFAGPIYHISSISEIIHIVMEPLLAMISDIAKDSIDRLDKHCPDGTTYGTCDIKSLYTKIRHNLN